MTLDPTAVNIMAQKQYKLVKTNINEWKTLAYKLVDNYEN